MSVYLAISLYLSIYPLDMSICLSLYVCLSTYLSVYLSALCMSLQQRRNFKGACAIS